MFGTGVSKAVPLPSYALFCARDCLTILFSFNLPPALSKALPDNVAGMSSLSAAQILAPASTFPIFYFKGQYILRRERKEIVTFAIRQELPHGFSNDSLLLDIL
ncbi:hypothetical protein AA313_de0205376 [Arthrobotrys entomopaga]|nr:hypothetical protein AA313_de0205376 [Arthrobotrys entomopaga]